MFLDFGFSFGAEGRFFEEYLQPRSGSKLHDLLRLGLVPEVNGIYRRDALQPDGLDGLDGNPAVPLWDSGLQSYEDAVVTGDWTPDVVFVSHAHLDHVGYLSYLGNIPLVCSETTESLLNAITDVGNLSGFDGDLVSIRERSVDEFGERAYFPGEVKIETGDPHPRESMAMPAGDSVVVDGDVSIQSFSVGHSIPGTVAAVIESADQQVVYTGDIRFHGRTGIDLGEELRGLRPDVMLCEGTRIDEAEPDDEQRVEDELTDVIAETEGLVMVGFSWKDLERYETVRTAAHRAGRIPVFDPRLAYLNARLGGSIYDDDARAFVERTDSMLYSPGDYTRSKHKAGELPISEWDANDGVVDTVHLDEGVTATDIRDSPHRYVLQLDYYRFQNLVDLAPLSGSRYVRAQTEPFNTEMELSADRLTNWLRQFGINEANDYEPIQIHASGHASGPELQEMINKIKPKTLIPIHTEHPELFENPSGTIVDPTLGKAITI